MSALLAPAPRPDPRTGDPRCPLGPRYLCRRHRAGGTSDADPGRPAVLDTDVRSSRNTSSMATCPAASTWPGPRALASAGNPRFLRLEAKVAGGRHRAAAVPRRPALGAGRRSRGPDRLRQRLQRDGRLRGRPGRPAPPRHGRRLARARPGLGAGLNSFPDTTMSIDEQTRIRIGLPASPASDHPDASAHDASLDLRAIVTQLRQARERRRTAQDRPRETSGRELPSREALADILAGLRGALFPMRLGPPDLRQENEDYFVGHTLDTVLHALLGQVRLELGHQARSRGESSRSVDERALRVAREFGAALPAIRELLWTPTCWRRTAAIRRRAASTRSAVLSRAARRDPPSHRAPVARTGRAAACAHRGGTGPRRHRHRHPPGRAHRLRTSSSTTAPAS